MGLFNLVETATGKKAKYLLVGKQLEDAGTHLDQKCRVIAEIQLFPEFKITSKVTTITTKTDIQENTWYYQDDYGIWDSLKTQDDFRFRGRVVKTRNMDSWIRLYHNSDISGAAYHTDIFFDNRIMKVEYQELVEFSVKPNTLRKYSNKIEAINLRRLSKEETQIRLERRNKHHIHDKHGNKFENSFFTNTTNWTKGDSLILEPIGRFSGNVLYTTASASIGTKNTIIGFVGEEAGSVFCAIQDNLLTPAPYAMINHTQSDDQHSFIGIPSYSPMVTAIISSIRKHH